MASKARPEDIPDAPTSPWSFTNVAGAAMACGVALLSLYIRRSGLPAVVSWLSPAPAGPQLGTYCYASVVTLADDKPIADAGPRCFSVENGHFTSVAAATPSSEILPGHVIPGLWDGHGHLIMYGEFLASVDLFGSSSAADVRGRLRTYLDAHPGVGGHDVWLRGFGWDQMAMGGAMPTADQLAGDGEDDDTLQGLYVMLDRVDGHCIWVSQAVLDLLPDELLDMPGGEIVREPGPGVFCDNAMSLVLNQWPGPSRAQKTEYIRLAMREMRTMGLVGMHDAGAVPQDLQLYSELAGRADAGWTMRVYAMVECVERNTFCADDVAGLRQEGDFLSIRSVKLFAGGLPFELRISRKRERERERD